MLYVTQRQGGEMIEGHRELVDGQKPSKDVSATADTINESQFNKLVGQAKYALRIDLRNNNADSSHLMSVLDTLEIIGKRFVCLVIY